MKSILYVFDYLILRKVVDNYHHRTKLINTQTFRVNIKTTLKIKLKVVLFCQFKNTLAN